MDAFIQLGDLYLAVKNIVSIRQDRKQRHAQFIISDGQRVYPLIFTNAEADAIFHWLDEYAEVRKIF